MEIDLQRQDHVAILTLAAPERRNALTAAMARELIAALVEVERDDSLCGLIVCGADGYFCAGGERGSLADVGRDPAEDSHFQDMDAIYQSFSRLAELSVPTIAAVRGGAVGAGINLALATDVCIVARDAVFRSGFLRIGAHPGGGHFALMQRRIGLQATVAMTFLEREVRGEEAVRQGLALEAVDDADVEARALALAANLCDPELVRFAIRTMRAEVAAHELPIALALRAEQAGQMWSLRRSGSKG